MLLLIDKTKNIEDAPRRTIIISSLFMPFISMSAHALIIANILTEI